MIRGKSVQIGLKIGTPVAALPGARRRGVSAGTGWPGVSKLLLGEVANLICNFYLSVAAREIVRSDLSLRYTSTAVAILPGPGATGSEVQWLPCQAPGVIGSVLQWLPWCFMVNTQVCTLPGV